MLWAYFDESGEHASEAVGGGLKKLTVSGCIATFEAWERLSMYWSDAIAKMDIPAFHMSKFENRAKPFTDWTETQRKARLNALLDIIGASVLHCCSFTNIARRGENTSKIYERCMQDVLVGLSKYDEEFEVVFAEHPEFGHHTKLANSLREYGVGKQIRSCTTARPIDKCQLQAADIVSYEMSRMQRDCMMPIRYPLRRLKELGCLFRFESE